MDARLGWALAVVAVALGYVQYGWQGVLLAMSGIVFWLLLQFTRALHAMRVASGAPVGHVASAVMLHARLKAGLRLMDILRMTRSLGEKLADEGPAQAETFRWTDASGASVTVELVRGRCVRWALARPADADGGAAGGGPPA